MSDGKRCTVCKTITLEQTQIKALGHSPDFRKEKQSTCSEHGNPDYWHCSRCGGNFAEEECVTTLSQNELEYPLGDHTYKLCFNNARHYKIATCGHELEEKDGGDHNFTDNTCTDCGFHNYGVVYTLNDAGTAYSVTGRTRRGYSEAVEIYGEFDGLPVTEIAKDAFNGDYLTGITLPASITNVNSTAFNRCSKLAEITVDSDNQTYHSKGNCLIERSTRTLVAGCKDSVIPADSSVISIGNNAFSGCSGLTEISVPYAVTHIGFSAFSDCSNLTKITLSERLDTISSSAFENCRSLTEITLPASVKTIGGHAFYSCTKLSAINIPYGVKKIGQFTFYDCESLTSITLPSTLTEIEYRAFWYCTNLAEVNFSAPYNLTSIRLYAFENCTSLKKIHIPSSVTSFSAASFENCSGLEEITVGLNNQKYMGVNNCVIDKDENALIFGCNNSVIPDDCNITKISGAFQNCPRLTAVHIPASVTKINEYAFSDMQSLSEITVDEANANYYVEGNCLIERSSKKLILGCKFSIIPNDGSVTEIGAYAFNGCTGLENLHLPACVTKIGNSAFRGTDVKNLYIDDLESYLQLKYASSNSAQYPILINGGNIYVNDELLTEFTAPDGLTEIRRSAFENCLSLTKVVIPEYVTSIGYDTFYGCENVTEFYLGNGVTELPNLRSMTNLKTLVIGNGITEIETNAFMSLTQLSSVTFGENITEIGSFAFARCTSLTEIVLPKNLQVLTSGAFYSCSNLTTVTIYGNITAINYNAFRNCTSLTDVYFDGTKEKWLTLVTRDWYGVGEYTVHFNDGTTM